MQRVVVSALFIFVESNGGSSKATVMTCCRRFIFFFSFFLFACSRISLPTGLFCRHLLPLHVVFARKQQVSSSCCFARTTAAIFFVLLCLCNRHHLLLFSAYGVPLAIAAFPFLSNFLASQSSEHLSFLSLFVFVLFCLFSFSFSSLFLWFGLFCCVLVPGTEYTLAFY